MHRMFRVGGGLLLLLLVVCGTAQNRDRVWVFGEECGIKFMPPDTHQTFTSVTHAREVAASIADTAGDLKFYYAIDSPTRIFPGFIANREDSIMKGSKYLYGAHSSSTNGALIIPIPEQGKQYYLFTISDTLGLNDYLFYHKIDMRKDGGMGQVISKNNLLYGKNLAEKLAATKHMNGEDWWVLAHETPEQSSGDSTNVFVKFLVTSSDIKGPFTDSIGPKFNEWGFVGEMEFSENGRQLAVTDGVSGTDLNKGLDLYRFNRCNGKLYGWNHLSSVPYYGVCFSPRGYRLYGTTCKNSCGEPEILVQYNLNKNNVKSSRKIIWKRPNGDVFPSQLELAPNGKIYLATEYKPFQDTASKYNKNLSVINQPDSLGLSCDFDTASFFLGGNTSRAGLPNMPNYESGPLVREFAEAGPDTTTCYGGPARLGTPGPDSVIYDWYPKQNLSNPSAPQPIAYPTDTTTYYLTVTDTTADTSVTCATTMDSVTVHVRPLPQANFNRSRSTAPQDSAVFRFQNQSTQAVRYRWHFGDSTMSDTSDPTHTYSQPGTYQVTLVAFDRCDNTDTMTRTVTVENKDWKIRPNPARDYIYLRYGIPADSIVTLHLYDLLGRQLNRYRLPPGRTWGKLDVRPYAPGLYLYTVRVNGRRVTAGKVVVVE